MSNQETEWSAQAERAWMGGWGMVCGRADTAGAWGAVSPPGLVRLSLRASTAAVSWGISEVISCPQAAVTARWAGFPASPSLWLKVQAQQQLCKQLSWPSPNTTSSGKFLWPSLACSPELLVPGGQALPAFSITGWSSWVREGRTGIGFCLL